MVTKEALDYVRQQLDSGVSKESIAQALAANGWATQDIEQMFAPPMSAPQPPVMVSTESAVTSPPRQRVGTLLGLAIAVLMLGGAGAAYAAYSYGLFSSPQEEATAADIVVTASSTPQMAVVASSTASTAIDCKSDMTCFYNAMDNACASAKVNYSLHSDFSGLVQIGLTGLSDIRYEVKGKAASSTCSVAQTYLSMSYAYDKTKLTALSAAQKAWNLKVYDDVTKDASSTMSRSESDRTVNCEGTSADLKQFLLDMSKMVIRDKYAFKCEPLPLPKTS